MIKRFNSFYESVHLNDLINTNIDEDEWEEWEDEEYEFASEGSVLYTFSLLYNGDIDVSERIAKLLPQGQGYWNIIPADKAKYIYFNQNEFDKNEEKTYLREGGHRLGIQSQFSYIFNADGVDEVKDAIKGEVGRYVDNAKRNIEQIKLNVEMNRKRYQDSIKLRTSMDAFNMRDFIDQLEVADNEWVEMMATNGADGFQITDTVYTEEEMADYIERGNQPPNKTRISWSRWNLRGNFDYKYRNNRNVHSWSRDIDNVELFDIIFKGNKKPQSRAKLIKIYPAQKSKYSRLKAEFEYGNRNQDKRIQDLENTIKNLENLDIEKYL